MKKKKENKKNSLDFLIAIQNKKIPILTLDEKWYNVFPEYEKPLKIRNLEKKVNKLLKDQGKFTSENKEMKLLKQQLIDGIVSNMDMEADKKGGMLSKKLQKSKDLLEELNEKLEKNKEELLDIPAELDQLNRELMAETLCECYRRWVDNRERIEQILEWEEYARTELNRKILERQTKEDQNEVLVSYLKEYMGNDVFSLLETMEEKS